MSTTILFNDCGWDVMSNSWTAGSKGGESTDLYYLWGSSDSNACWTSLEIPLKTFFNYVADCQSGNRIADLREENLESIKRQYTNPANQKLHLSP